MTCVITILYESAIMKLKALQISYPTFTKNHVSFLLIIFYLFLSMINFNHPNPSFYYGYAVCNYAIYQLQFANHREWHYQNLFPAV